MPRRAPTTSAAAARPHSRQQTVSGRAMQRSRPALPRTQARRSRTRRPSRASENLQVDVLAGIALEIRHERIGAGEKIARVAVESRVGQELSRGSFAALDARENRL